MTAKKNIIYLEQVVLKHESWTFNEGKEGTNEIKAFDLHPCFESAVEVGQVLDIDYVALYSFIRV